MRRGCGVTSFDTSKSLDVDSHPLVRSWAVRWSGFPLITFGFLGSYWNALLLGFWGALVVGPIDNVLRPFVVGARDKQHPMPSH